MSAQPRVLLILSGGIAAYKCLEVIRRLRDRDVDVRCILTRSGAEFVTPLSLGAISNNAVYEHTFSLTDEHEIGHIRLARECDLLLVAPATANILAKMARGIADDLATTCLLATDSPVMIAPAMNPHMWEHAATQANLAMLADRGVMQVGPGVGEMAESGERGVGRMAEPNEIVTAVTTHLARAGVLAGSLSGRRALVTSGPTHEPIDPVRYIANRSSGKQGHAIARALASMGAETTLVSGPTALADPVGVTVHHVETAIQMMAACEAALPSDVAVCAAAVADWRSETSQPSKIKKDGGDAPTLSMVENPDILATLSRPHNRRPGLVIGFAAETDNLIEHAIAKRQRKKCDWIVANDVSAAAGTFGSDLNAVHLITEDGTDAWPLMSKDQVARQLGERIAGYLEAAS